MFKFQDNAEYLSKYQACKQTVFSNIWGSCKGNYIVNTTTKMPIGLKCYGYLLKKRSDFDE